MPHVNRPFLPTNTNAIAATATSQSRAMPNAVGEVGAAFYNDGPGVAFVVTGGAAVVATLPTLTANTGAVGNATPVPVGASVNLSYLNTGTDTLTVTHWAAICPAAGTANVYCTAGSGV